MNKGYRKLVEQSDQLIAEWQRRRQLRKSQQKPDQLSDSQSADLLNPQGQPPHRQRK